MTAATATRDIFDALDPTADKFDAIGERFAAVSAPVVAPVVHCLGGCGRVLTSPASIARGMGKTCYRNAKRRAEALGPEFSDRQVEAAIEAIEDGAVVPSGITGTWLVVGSRGDKVYATTLHTCECEAFAKAGRSCWHRASVTAVSA